MDSKCLFFNSVCMLISSAVIQFKGKKGETFNITWETSSILASGVFHVYHKNVNNTVNELLNWTILNISKEHPIEESNVSSYAYKTVNLEIRNVTPEDAGYYQGGPSTSAVMSGGGAILIVLGMIFLKKIIYMYDAFNYKSVSVVFTMLLYVYIFLKLNYVIW